MGCDHSPVTVREQLTPLWRARWHQFREAVKSTFMLDLYARPRGGNPGRRSPRYREAAPVTP
jgi:hypothetical protein